MSSIKENKNWKAYKAGQYFLLEYMPGVLGETGAIISISEEVYIAAQMNDMTLDELFSKFNLSSNKVLSTLKPPLPQVKKSIVNTINRYQGVDFIVTIEDGKYFLEYRLSTQGDGSRRFEINKDIYEFARNERCSTSDIFKKFNLYYLDKPENNFNC